MKKYNIFLFLFVLVFSFLLVGCTSIEFESETLEMKKGTSTQLEPIVKGKGDVEWTSSNALVVTVENGTINAVGVGSATVSAKIKDKEATVIVTVTEQMPNSIILRADDDLDFYIAGNTYQFSASILPKNADQSVTFASSNTNVATISADGKVSVLAAGQTTITATSVKDTSKSDSYTINAKLPDPESITITGENKIEIDETTTLSASISPSFAAQSVSWVSADDSIATVSADGTVTGISAGKVYITAKSLTKDTVIKNFEVEVVIPSVKNIVIVGAENGVFVGATTQLSATVTPELAPQDVTWESDNPAIATVDENGLVTGIKSGQVFITVKSASDPTKTKSELFDVKVPPERPNNNAILIDPYFDGLKFDTTKYNGLDFVESYNLFRSLDGIDAEIKENTVIYFNSGDIDGTCTISSSGVKIYGPNKDVNPRDTTKTRETEATLVGTIKFTGTLENIEINGIELAGAASIVKDPTGTFKNFTFANNTSSAEDLLTSLVVIDLATNTNLVNENIILLNNSINGVTNEANTTVFFRGSNIKNLLVNNNRLFMCASSDEAEKIIELGGDFNGTTVTSTGYGINGKIEFINNELTSSQTRDIDILAYATEETTIDILNNNFAGKTWQYVSSSKVGINGYKGAKATIHVDYNLFYNGFRGVLIATNGVTAQSQWTATVNYNLFDFYDFQAGYIANRLYNSSNTAITGFNDSILLDARYNLYRDSQSKKAYDTDYATRLVGVSAESKTTGYADENEIPRYSGSYSTSFN